VVPVYGFCTLKLILCIQRDREREKLLLFFRMSLCVLPALFTLYEHYKFACLHAVANAKYKLQYFIITFQYTYTDVLVTLLLDFAISVQKIYSFYISSHFYK